MRVWIKLVAFGAVTLVPATVAAPPPGVCTNGRVEVDGECVCPTDKEWVDNSCKPKCIGGSFLQGEACVCREGFAWYETACKPICTGGRIRGTNDECECEAGKEWAIDQCKPKCTNGKIRKLNGNCECPDNTHEHGGKCVATCHWKTARSDGIFTCPWSAPLSAKPSLSLVGDCKLVPPVPKDNYVADDRVNKPDSLEKALRTDPLIEIGAAKQKSAWSSSEKATWRGYEHNPVDVANEVKLTSFGVYDLSMKATDYRYKAECPGCVAVVDNYPPTSDDGCEVDNPYGPVWYSRSALNEAKHQEDLFDKFDDNVLNNGPSERCDDVCSKRTNFYETEPCEIDVETPCFTDKFIEDLLVRAENEPIDPATDGSQCSLCCEKSRKLREYYYEYQCGVDPDTLPKKKSAVVHNSKGKCSFEHCLVVPAKTLIDASVRISDAAEQLSTATRQGLPAPVPAKEPNTIYRSVKCTAVSSEPDCYITATLDSLLTRSAEWTNEVKGDVGRFTNQVNKFVKWGYALDVNTWFDWDETTTLTFDEPETTVYVKGWTQCGEVVSYAVDVRVYAHNARNACTDFKNRWTEIAPIQRKIETALEAYTCNYPKSDFTLFKFEFISENHVEKEQDEVVGKYTSVTCSVQGVEAPEVGASTFDGVPSAQILTHTSTNAFVINKQIAVELVRNPNTAINTNVKLTCAFTFQYHNDEDTDVDTCDYKLTLTDCDGPELETDGEEEVCKFGQCLDPVGAGGPFEACGGDVFVPGSAAKKTHQGCCPTCDSALSCSAFPLAADGMQRCEPVPHPALAMMAAEAATARVAEVSTMTALAGVSALVAIVALVVVKTRAARAKQPLDDAYLSLLD